MAVVTADLWRQQHAFGGVKLPSQSRVSLSKTLSQTSVGCCVVSIVSVSPFFFFEYTRAAEKSEEGPHKTTVFIVTMVEVKAFNHSGPPSIG